jgi:transposase
VRMVLTLRAELGTEHGTVYRVARQLGYGVESVRSWVRQADIDFGYAPGVSTAKSQRIRHLEQENRELKRALVLNTKPDPAARVSPIWWVGISPRPRPMSCGSPI